MREVISGLTPKEKIKGLVLPKEITPDLAYFCGFMAGDGSMGYREDKKDHWIKAVGNPKDEVDYYDIIIKNLIKQLFNISIKPKLHDSGKSYGFSFSSKSIVNYLHNVIGLPIGKKYDSLIIPKYFLSDDILVRNFISGLADTDFHLAIKKRDYPVISGVSKSKPFINEVKMFLQKDGYKANGYERRQFDKRVNKILITHSVEISGYKYLSK